MLQKLYIKNFAIIDVLEIEFSDKLNIITGETGAGKSIILGALGLIKGERANTQLIRNEANKSIIEAHFDLSKSNLEPLFIQYELEFQNSTIIRRELSAEGKTRAFVNDSPCNLNTLSEIGNRLVEIHSQHDSLELKSTEYQMNIVDAFAENQALLSEMKESMTALRAVQKELQLAITSQSKSQAEKELNQYHFQELNQFDFSDWNIESLEEELNLSENSMEIKQQLQASVNSISQAEMSLLDSLKEILSRMRKLDKFSKELTNINENLDSSIDQLADIASEYERLSERIDLDEEKLNELNEKYTFVQKMLKKHNLKTIEELNELKLNLETTLSWVENLADTIQKLEKDIEIKKTGCLQLAKRISDRRSSIIPILEEKLLSNLNDLELGNSQFKIDLKSNEDWLTDDGFDKIHFLFSANAGTPPRELKNSISGGEMSRFMLAIKSMLAEKISLPTLIFDEIDTGVSGLVANRVATMLSRLSNHHQMIAITHLPQIASRGFHHFNVYKKTENNQTSTHIKLLHQADREIEIAKMISGENITQASLTSARELLRLS